MARVEIVITDVPHDEHDNEVRFIISSEPMLPGALTPGASPEKCPECVSRRRRRVLGECRNPRCNKGVLEPNLELLVEELSPAQGAAIAAVAEVAKIGYEQAWHFINQGGSTR